MFGAENEHSKFSEEDKANLMDLLRARGDGSMMRGWRRVLDMDGLLSVGYQDFVQAAAKMHYFGDVVALFGISQEDANVLEMKDLAPYEGAVMQRFREWVRDKWGSPLDFFNALDTEDKGELSLAEFSAGCQKHNINLSTQEITLVFECCDASGDNMVSSEEMIFLELDGDALAQMLYNIKLGKMLKWKQQTTQEYLDVMKQRKEAEREGQRFHAAHRRAPRPWLDKYFEMMPTVACQARQIRAKEACKRAVKAKEKFDEHVHRTYGHEVRAMRRGLATNSFEFTQQNLRGYLGKHNVNIAVADLWLALDMDQDGTVPMEEFCKSRAMVLARFQRWARQQFGSCAAIWATKEAADASRKLTGTWFAEKSMLFGVFKETLRSLKWPNIADGETRKLVFGSLDLHGLGLIGRDDLAWLDQWSPAEWVIADPSPADWEKMKALLVKTYGHPLRAWRSVLDQDDSNHITWNEFKEACRRIKFDGSAGGAWLALDTELCGSITMKVYDKPSFDLLCSFKEWAEAHFGSIYHCFQFLDEDKSGTVTFKELKRACMKLRWPGDVRLLFNCLDIDGHLENGKRSLNLSEINFLDNWQTELSQTQLELLEEEEELAHTMRLKRRSMRGISSVSDRLACPLDPSKMGFNDWAAFSQSSTGPGRRLGRDPKLPRLVHDAKHPYAVDSKQLWGKSMSGMSTFSPPQWAGNMKKERSKLAKTGAAALGGDAAGGQRSHPSFEGTLREAGRSLSLSALELDNPRSPDSPKAVAREEGDRPTSSPAIC